MREREILFRGKRCDNGKWCYGYLVESHRSWNGLHPHKSWIFDSPFSNGGWIALMGRHAVIDNTVGQYTGLTDKNGTKIFEGDILYPISKRPYLVFWNDEEVRFMLKNSRGFCLNIYKNIADEYEVIGNVFDDPDLLKGGENE